MRCDDTPPVLMIAFWQALAVYFLCLVAKNRGYALLVGLAGAVVVSITGGNRYDALDVLFVVVATLAAIWKLTPYEEGETRGKALAFAAKAAGVVVLLIVCGVAGLWFDAPCAHSSGETRMPKRSLKIILRNGLLILLSPLLFPVWWLLKMCLFGRTGLLWLDSVFEREKKPAPSRVVLNSMRRTD